MIEKFQLFWLKVKRCVNVTWQKILLKMQTALLFRDVSEGYFCPCCGKHCLSFVDLSSVYRNAICPNCDSQPRHRALALYLDKQANFEGEKIKFLHFAPASSLRRRFSSMSNLEYTTADLNNSSVDVKIDVTQIPYPDNTFDVIFCNHVLEHVMDDRQAMRELFRVLKPGGWASLQVPLSRKKEKTFEDPFEDPTVVSPQERLRHFGQEDRVRLYGLDYKDRLQEAGFIVELENLTQILDSEQIRKYGVNPKEDLYFGGKLIDL